MDLHDLLIATALLLYGVKPQRLFMWVLTKLTFVGVVGEGGGRSSREDSLMQNKRMRQALEFERESGGGGEALKFLSCATEKQARGVLLRELMLDRAMQGAEGKVLEKAGDCSAHLPSP
eukprot:1154114-Pelagomonas_calceolata.AAC.3